MESTINLAGEITVELMQQILREAEDDSSIVVLPNLNVKVLNEDIHIGSCLIRVTVSYIRNGETSPHSLPIIVKVAPKNNFVSSTIQLAEFFPREIQMFEEILPRMSALLSRTLGNCHIDFTARKYYTRKTPSYLIAIEDLASKGFKPPKRGNGLDLKHCSLALRTLARFHATSVMLHRENSSLFEVFWNQPPQERGQKEAKKDMFMKVVGIVSQLVGSWPEFGPKWADRLRRRFQTLLEDIEPLLEKDDGGFNILTHGDFGINNVMYHYSEPGGEVEAIMLVDFQCCCYKSPVIDLHRFIFTSADDEVKATHLDSLLKEYHAELTITLETLGLPREQTISLTHLLDEFENKMLYGFYCAAFVQPFMNIDLNTKSGFSQEDILKSDPNDLVKKLQSIITDSCFDSVRKQMPFFIQKQLL